jgi:hypothetical protein
MAILLKIRTKYPYGQANTINADGEFDIKIRPSTFEL